MIAVFVREKHAVKLCWRNAALLEAQHQLPRAQPAIDENLAMIGCNQRAVPRAPASEHGQAEHGIKGSRVGSVFANGNKYYLKRGCICSKLLANLLLGTLHQSVTGHLV